MVVALSSGDVLGKAKGRRPTKQAAPAHGRTADPAGKTQPRIFESRIALMTRRVQSVGLGGYQGENGPDHRKDR